MKALFGNAYLLLILATLSWGGNAVAGRMAAETWLPFTITALRWSIVLLVVTPFAYKHVLREWTLIRNKLWLLFGLCGLGVGGFNLLMYLSLNYTTAINVSILQASIPMLIFIASFLILGLRVTTLQMTGLSVAILGVVLTATSGNPLSFLTNGLNRGDLIMLAAAALYAAYSFGLRWKPAISWQSFMLVMAVFACAVSIPFAVWELQAQNHPDPGSKGWLLLAFVVIFPTILGQLFFAKGVELIGANRAGQFINLVPIFGALLAVLLLRESFHWYHAIGLCLVLTGIALAEKKGARS